MSKRVVQPRRRRAALLSIATICAVSLPSAVLLAGSPASANDDKFASGKKVSQGAVAGDSQAVAQASTLVSLTDGVGVKFDIHTLQINATTSSASGAADEASFVAPTVASTELGGTTNYSLSDGFDGYNALATFVGGTPLRSSALQYNQLGAPTTACNGRELVFPNQVNGALTVSRKVFVPSDAGYARWTDSVTNTSATATLATLYIDNNLGSDGDTVITGSSSGDLTSSIADTWVSTFSDWSSGKSTDPRIGHVLQGTGAGSTMVDNVFLNGDDTPFWTYQFTVQPGETKSILNYSVLRGTKPAAAAAAAAIAAQAPDVCLTQDEANAVQNFNGLGAKPTLTLPANVQAPATGPTGSAVAYGAAAVDGNGKAVPVTCTPASGSVFPVGVTTVTCTATDAQGRTTTGTFTVTVGAYVAPPVVYMCAGQVVTIVAKAGVPTTGTTGKDVILGTAGADSISSLGGGDVICAGGGRDKVNAGGGNDKVKGGGGNDRVTGKGGKDLLKGNGGNDTLSGGAGKDRLLGNGGKDTLTGGPGLDVLKGGPGKDTVDGRPG